MGRDPLRPLLWAQHYKKVYFPCTGMVVKLLVSYKDPLFGTFQANKCVLRATLKNVLIYSQKTWFFKKRNNNKYNVFNSSLTFQTLLIWTWNMIWFKMKLLSRRVSLNNQAKTKRLNKRILRREKWKIFWHRTQRFLAYGDKFYLSDFLLKISIKYEFPSCNKS